MEEKIIDAIHEEYGVSIKEAQQLLKKSDVSQLLKESPSLVKDYGPSYWAAEIFFAE